MKKFLCILLMLFAVMSVAACESSISEQSESASEDTVPESVTQAQALIKEGKYYEAYAALYADKDNEDAKALLDKFLVVPTVIEGRSYTDYNLTQEIEYNEYGDKILVTTVNPLIKGNEDGTVTKYEYVYDGNGNITKSVMTIDNSDSQTVIEYEYDSKNNPIKIIEDWKTTENVYDENGNVIKEIATDDSDNIYVSEFTYDEKGNQLSVKSFTNGEEWESKEFSYEYNDKGDIIKIALTNNIRPESSYDTVYDCHYDENGRIIKKVTSVSGQIIASNGPTIEEFEYNDKGDIVKLTKTTATYVSVTEYEYTYNESGDIVKERSVKNAYNSSTYIDNYDEFGNMTLHQNGDKFSKNEYTYDENGFTVKKVTTERDPLFYKNDKVYTFEYTNDELGNVLKIVTKDPNNMETVSEFVYDDESRILKETRTEIIGGQSNLYYVDEFTYDDKGNILSYYHKYYSQESTVTYGYVYDDKGNILEKSKNGQPDIKYTYDENGNVLKNERYRNGKYFLNNEYTYDAKGFMIYGTRYDEAGKVIGIWENVYDKNSNLLKESVKKGEAYPGGDYSYEYTYDELGNKLTSLEFENTAGNVFAACKYTYSEFKYIYVD
jgi:YD repeat-containing protein